MGQRGLRHVKLRRRFVEPARLDDGDEISVILQFHAGLLPPYGFPMAVN